MLMIKAVIKLVLLHRKVHWMVTEYKVRWVGWDKIMQYVKSHTV